MQLQMKYQDHFHCPLNVILLELLFIVKACANASKPSFPISFSPQEKQTESNNDRGFQTKNTRSDSHKALVLSKVFIARMFLKSMRIIENLF